MSLRILLTCEDYFPHIGGAEVCVHNLKKQFEKAGHQVTLFTNTIEETDPPEPNVVRVQWRFRIGALFRNIRTLWRLIGSCDIIHCQYSFRLACICAPIARLRKKPMILTQQGKGIVPEENPRLLASLFTKLCQHVSMRGARHITATSDEIVDLTAAFVPRSKITLISNGYDSERFQPNPTLPVPAELAKLSSDIKKILSVRRLVPKNGIHIMVQALALVREKNPNFHYFVIGEGRVREFIEALIAKLGLEKHVTLLGKRRNDDLPSYYQHADLITIPSSAEARSIACVEAMGMGKPVIASRVGGLIDLLGKNNERGTLVSLYNSEACTYDPPDTLPKERLENLANAILEFLAGSKEFNDRAARALEMVQREYSWERIVGEYSEVYTNVSLR